jgi:LysM repeat protein
LFVSEITVVPVMKNLFWASSLFASLALTASGVDKNELRAQITEKEKQLLAVQEELVELRKKLSASPEGSRRASHTVRTGETVHSIARLYQMAPDDLMKWNKITDPKKLAIGDTLIISKASSEAPTPTEEAVARPETSASTTYTVAKGDTFYSIARRHKMSLKQLKALNPDVSTHLIAPGQTLRVAGRATASAPKPHPTPPKPVVNKPTPKPKPAPPVIKNEKPTKAPSEKAPPLPPKSSILEDPKPKAATSLIILDEVVTFDEFAKKHGTTTEVLNKLNGWNLPKATVLARGSEINVPN